jgi:hypothetical protein
MATIQTPSLPPRLFRYRSITRDKDALVQELAAITDKYVWCSEFGKLNDPMEGSYDPSSVLKASINYRNIVDDIVRQKVGVGIASFSEVKHSELMWTHYASNHSGICIAYSSRALFKALPDAASIVRVGYAEAPPILSSRDARDTSAAAVKIFSQKKVGWHYEREWRVLGETGRVRLKGPQCVRAIYLGTRLDPAHRSKIITDIKQLKIPIYEMRVEGYDHVSKKLRRIS